MSAKNRAHEAARDVTGSGAPTAVFFDGAMSRACRFISRLAPAGVILMAASQVVIAAGDAERGAKLFRNCLACHSAEAGRHLTGPSLANHHLKHDAHQLSALGLSQLTAFSWWLLRTFPALGRIG